MVCPFCQAETPDDSTRCAACHADLVDGGGETRLAGETQASDDADLTRLSSAATGPRPSGHLAIGAVVANRYRIDSLLGMGGMGSVYRAWDRELDVPVALKVIRPDILADPKTGQEFLERFKRELLTARAVTHRNVLRIHDLGETNGLKFITMPLIDGEDLHSVLKSKRLPFDQVLDIGRQLTAGLAAAHEAGIIHRDLKPQNVLVGTDGTAYISDFGLAKSIQATTVHMTRTGEFVGTPQYISPEQVEGQGADHRSDLYALGLILYEMVCGSVPFAAPSALETMLARVRGTPPPPEQLQPEVPDFFSQIVMRCLEKDPNLRYQHASEVLADLQAETPPAALAPAPAAPRPLSSRPWLIGLAGAAAMALVLLGFSYFGSTTSGPSVAADVAVPEVSPSVRMAVLPFEVAGDEESLGYIATGLRESLTAKLFHVDDVALSSGSAVERASALPSAVEIADSLGVTLLVGGTVQGTGDRLNITAYLDDVERGSRVWTKEYSGLRDDLLALQNQVFQDLTGALHLTLDQDEVAATISQPAGIEAYELYLRGRTAMRNDQNLDNVERALGLFKQAAEQDSRFALAYAGIADASLRLYRERRDQKYVTEALGAAQQALSIDDSLPEVHSALGNVYQATSRNAEAIVELRRAAELAPNSDEAYRRLGRAYMADERRDEAFDAFRRAVIINPYHWVNHGALGAALLETGEFAAAAEAFERVIELEPQSATGFNDLGVARLLEGNLEAAVSAFAKAIELDPETDAYGNLGAALFYLGRYEEAIGPFEKAVELNPNSELEVGNLGDVYRLAGRPEQANEQYRKAIGLALNDLKVNPGNAAVQQRLALYYAKLGDDRQARRLIDNARRSAPSDAGVLYADALIHAFAGQMDQGLEALREALEAGKSRAEVDADPDARGLREAPGYSDLSE